MQVAFPNQRFWPWFVLHIATLTLYTRAVHQILASSVMRNQITKQQVTPRTIVVYFLPQIAMQLYPCQRHKSWAALFHQCMQLLIPAYHTTLNTPSAYCTTDFHWQVCVKNSIGTTTYYWKIMGHKLWSMCKGQLYL